jgi:hypothetical protein
MKLRDLYEQADTEVLNDYLKKLRRLCESTNRKIISEAKITITIDDDDKDAQVSAKPEIPQQPAVINNHYGSGFTSEAKQDFISKAKAIGEFSNPEWVGKLLKSMEHTGVQGFNKICEDEQPVTNKQIRQLIGILIDLIDHN